MVAQVMKNIKKFFGIWFVIILLNQIFIFHACFAPYCLLAALPHTGVIAFFFTWLFVDGEQKIKETEQPIDTAGIPPRSKPNTTVSKPPPAKKIPALEDLSIDSDDLFDENISDYQEHTSKKPAIDNKSNYNYKDLPIIDGEKYRGYIREKFYDNEEHILLEIENIGTFKIRLPKRRPWDQIKINEPFMFVREKYQGVGKQNQYMYSKLNIIDTGMESFVPKQKCKKENGIVYYDIYHPWHGGHNPEFNKFSGHILDLKSEKPGIVDYFFNLLKNSDFDRADAIVIVPSHDPRKKSSSVKLLAKKLAQHKNLIDATDTVIRTRKIAKLAQGGNRDVSVHLNSLDIQNASMIRGKNVLVFDDVTTTGNSLHATMQLLKRNGAHSVCSYVIGYTG